MDESPRIPRHLALIPDGNRRYARAHGIPVPEGYMIGLDKIVETVSWLRDKGVRHVTGWAASHENVLQRPRAELMGVFAAVNKFLDGLLEIPGVGIHIFGDLDSLPDWVPGRSRLLEMRHGHEEGEMTVHLALNYSGSDETGVLMAAVAEHGLEAVAAHPEDYLLSRGVPPIDLLVRTGGQQRLSGFLPFQAGYAELWFLNKLWPELSTEDMEEAFAWYATQQRNFGK